MGMRRELDSEERTGARSSSWISSNAGESSGSRVGTEVLGSWCPGASSETGKMATSDSASATYNSKQVEWAIEATSGLTLGPRHQRLEQEIKGSPITCSYLGKEDIFVKSKGILVGGNWDWLRSTQIVNGSQNYCFTVSRVPCNSRGTMGRTPMVLPERLSGMTYFQEAGSRLRQFLSDEDSRTDWNITKAMAGQTLGNKPSWYACLPWAGGNGGRGVTQCRRHLLCNGSGNPKDKMQVLRVNPSDDESQ
jgi:hypothetical protein